MRQITIIDYGSGNVLSAQKSFIKVANDNNINAKVIISKNLNEIKNSSHIVLPGQGAFATCMTGLKKTPGIIDQLTEFAIINKKPFLGICVGMQMLATDSEENGLHLGLGWINGHIKILPNKELKMPHMGWNIYNLKKIMILLSILMITILFIRIILSVTTMMIYWQKLNME